MPSLEIHVIFSELSFKDWGVTGYYNAMVLGVVELDDTGYDMLKVKLFETRPSILIKVLQNLVLQILLLVSCFLFELGIHK